MRQDRVIYISGQAVLSNAPCGEFLAYTTGQIVTELPGAVTRNGKVAVMIGAVFRLLYNSSVFKGLSKCKR
jgi:hypothetical protein